MTEYFLKSFTAILVLFFTSTVSYSNDIRYSDIDLQSATLETLLSRYGTPLSKVTTGDITRLTFKNFLVVVENQTGLIESIIILDPDYVGPNGFKIGMTEELLRTNDAISQLSNQYIDTRFGMVYWVEKERISRFVKIRLGQDNSDNWMNTFSEQDIGTNQALDSFKTKYLAASDNKAFAQSKSGAWAWRSNRTSDEDAANHALIACRKNNGKRETRYPCKILNINGVWQTALGTLN